MALPRILKELLALPTAPFAEGVVLDYICRFCRVLPGVTCRPDRYGNLLARYSHRPRAITPLVFAAHTDHPGFVALEMRDRRTLRAAFRGGVLSSYFTGAKVRFWSGGRWVKGRVAELTCTVAVPRLGRGVSRPEEVLVRVAEPVARNAPGVWDLPAPTLRGDLLHAPACDDLAGVAAMLALLQRLSRKRPRAETRCLFTRAEEVGFIGAIGAAKAGSVEANLPIVAIEMSKELPGVQIGGGPILRVGDRLSVFNPEVTAFCGRVAQNLARRRRSFAFQRKLMDGGACESTAYAAYGYRATGVCLALGNYHNMDTARSRIAPEYISLTDWRRMVEWFEALVVDERGPEGDGARLRADFDRSFASQESLLEGSGRPPRRRRRG